MKHPDKINEARNKIVGIILKGGLNNQQLITLQGMLTALVWVMDGNFGGTVDRILNGEEII